jgi:hypothetical protein
MQDEIGHLSRHLKVLSYSWSQKHSPRITGKPYLRALSGRILCGTAEAVPFVQRIFQQPVKSCPHTKHEFFRNL